MSTDDLPDRIGRYLIGSQLGRGGFAVVVRAHDEGLDDTVAVKVLDPERAFDPELRARFVREARLLRRVQNPNVMAVFDIGELDDGRPYFVMEFAGGGVLRERFDRIAASGRDLQTVSLALRSGLGALHRAGIVHRDIKPDNLLVSGRSDASDTLIGTDRLNEDDRIIIGDLGLAKDHLVTGGGRTLVGGTPRFRAPEQLDETAAITPATDTYAATAVLWQMVTGSLPPDVLEAEIDQVDEGWAAFFRQGLARRPDDRFDTIDQWAEAALAVVDHHDGHPATATQSRTALAPGVCPYKGLAAYQPEDAALFFGREALVDELISRLQLLPTLVVAGPSGSGKSSLVRAGLVPAVERGALSGSHEWPVALMTPGTDPLAALHRHVERILPGPVPSLEQLADDPGAIRAAVGSGGALLVIDQFEEVFTAPTDRGAATVALLAELTRPEHQVRLVLALRADFYDRCAAHPWLARVINDNQVLVGPMQRSELRRAIEAPARRAGLRFEDGLVERVLDDAGTDTGSLPLVAHALMETWLRRRGNELTEAGYEAAGGVAGSIAQSAETAFARLDPEAADASRHLFLRLVTPADDNVVTRRHLPAADLDEADRALVDEWARSRLLTIDDNGIEITHEAMLSTWPRLRQWIEDSRDDLRTRQRIVRAADSWRTGDEDPALLYRGTPLDAALAWAGDHGQDLDGNARRFLDASAEQRDHELAAAADADRRQQRRRRRAIAALAVLAGAAVIASVLAVIALAQSRQDEERAMEAEEEANLRFAEFVAAQSSDDDPLLAVILGAEAMARAPRPPVEAMAALIDARRQVAESGPLPLGGPIAIGDAFRVDISEDGTQFAVATRSGSIEVGTVAEPTIRQTLQGHTLGIEALAFRPDGQQLASVGSDGRVRVWDLTADPPAGRDLVDLETILWDVAYDRTGEQLAAVSEVGGLHVIDPDSGDPIATFEADADLLSVAFAPTGDVVVAGSGPGTIHGWRLSDSSVVFADRQAHTSDVWEIAFDDTGDRLMTVSSDARIRLWDAASGASLAEPLTDPLAPDGRLADAITAIWLPDGTILAGVADGSLWAIDPSADTAPAVVIDGLHADSMLDVAVSSDGTRLVSVADDQLVRLIDNRPRQPVIDPIAELGTAGYSLAIAPSGQQLAAGTADGTVVIIPATGGDPVTVSGLGGRVSALAFVDDDTIVAGDEAGGLHRLGADGTVTASVEAHGAVINALDADADTVVTVSDDGQIRAWSAADLSSRGAGVGAGSQPSAVALIGDEALVGFAPGEVRRWVVGSDRLGEAVSVAPDRIWHIEIDEVSQRVSFSMASEAVALYDLDDLTEPLVEVSNFGGGATSSAFLAGARTVAAVSRDGDLRFVDVESGLPIGQALAAHEGQAWAVATAPRGAVIYSVGTDGVVAAIDVLDLDAACRIAAGALDMERRDDYLSDMTLAACPE